MRTTVPTVHIASGENIFGQQLFSIGLNDGYIVVAIHGTTFNKLIPFNINDGTWYTVRLEKTDQVRAALVFVSLTGALVGSSSWQSFVGRVSTSLLCMRNRAVCRTWCDRSVHFRMSSFLWLMKPVINCYYAHYPEWHRLMCLRLGLEKLAIQNILWVVWQISAWTIATLSTLPCPVEAPVSSTVS